MLHFGKVHSYSRELFTLIYFNLDTSECQNVKCSHFLVALDIFYLVLEFYREKMKSIFQH